MVDSEVGMENAPLTADVSGAVSSWSVSATKRIFDAAAASLGLAISLPAMGIIALLVKCTSPGPVLFRQTRTGQHGIPFKLLKFRTMRSAPGTLVTRKGDSRVTRVGRILRRTKLDELPQLVNVLRGEMSLVGPRPDLPQFWSTLNGSHANIMALRPGVTGRASLHFRDEESLLAAVPEEHLNNYYVSTLLPLKVKMDLEYAEGATLFTDIKVLLRTLTRLHR